MFGEAIRRLRQIHRLSLRQLAEKAEIDFTYLSKIESGNAYPPSEEVVKRLAAALYTDSAALLVLAPRVSQAKLWEAAKTNPRISYLVQKLMSGVLDDKKIEDMYEMVREGQPSGPETEIIDKLLKRVPEKDW